MARERPAIGLAIPAMSLAIPAVSLAIIDITLPLLVRPEAMLISERWRE
jgi:hypothetical protein